MTRIVFSPRFAKELAAVTSSQVENRIYNTLEIIEAMPTIGSSIIPKIIRAEFGEGILKMVVDPFDIFYEYFPEQKIVYVYTLILQRQAR